MLDARTERVARLEGFLDPQGTGSTNVIAGPANRWSSRDHAPRAFGHLRDPVRLGHKLRAIHASIYSEAVLRPNRAEQGSSGDGSRVRRSEPRDAGCSAKRPHRAGSRHRGAAVRASSALGTRCGPAGGAAIRSAVSRLCQATCDHRLALQTNLASLVGPPRHEGAIQEPLVLVVDDVDDHRALTGTMLEIGRFGVITTSNGLASSSRRIVLGPPWSSWT